MCMHAYVTCSTLSSRDTLLELEPTFASVLKQNYQLFKKLVVATVSTCSRCRGIGRCLELGGLIMNAVKQID